MFHEVPLWRTIKTREILEADKETHERPLHPEKVKKNNCNISTWLKRFYFDFVFVFRLSTLQGNQKIEVPIIEAKVELAEVDRKILLANIESIQPDHDMRAIKMEVLIFVEHCNILKFICLMDIHYIPIE